MDKVEEQLEQSHGIAIEMRILFRQLSVEAIPFMTYFDSTVQSPAYSVTHRGENLEIW
jgi:hypothetical protein